MKNYEWILFDLDGTISDPFLGLKYSLEYAFSKMRRETPSDDILRKFIGPPLVFSFMSFSKFTEEEAIIATKYYRERYKDVGIFENKLYDGIVDLLEYLKNKEKKISLATSKPEEYATIILKNFGIYKYFDFISANTLSESRPEKIDVIKYAIGSCDMNLKKSIMVGDTKYDILAGKELGIDTIGVLYGYGSRKEFEESNCDFIIEDVKKLYDFFKNT